MCHKLADHSYGSPVFMLNNGWTYHYVMSISLWLHKSTEPSHRQKHSVALTAH